MEFKITKTVEKIHHKEVTKFFVDGVYVATCRKYKEWFCTVDREGRPSNVRDKIKTAKDTSWECAGLVQLLGENVRIEMVRRTRSYSGGIFVDDFPDLTWGYSGSLLTPKKIKEAFKAFNEKTI